VRGEAGRPTSGTADALSVRRLGSGPPVLLVHGGVGPRLTWERQEPLAERWTLLIPARLGFRPSPPADRQDFERDVEGLAPLLGEGAHLVGFSYGGVSCALLTAIDPEQVRSLTLIEAPIYGAAPDDPEVMRLARMGDAFLAGEGDPEEDQEFMRRAGIDPDAPAEHRAEIAEAVAAARGGRSPSEARIDLDLLARAAIPTLIVSGGHSAAIERLCDALAGRLGARRERVTGAGHAVPRAPGFNEMLEAFLAGARAGEHEPYPWR
jgi:pimeloyl-ACP methyl ester carboxylesterase